MADGRNLISMSCFTGLYRRLYQGRPQGAQVMRFMVLLKMTAQELRRTSFHRGWSCRQNRRRSRRYEHRQPRPQLLLFSHHDFFASMLIIS